MNKRTKTIQGVPNLSKSGDPQGNDMTENDEEKAEVLANFFSSVFTIEKDGNWSLPEGPVRHNGLVNINESAVLNILGKINKTKSPGPDGINPRVLWEARVQLFLPLCIMFNSSIRTRSLPDDWLHANGSAIHKKGTKLLHLTTDQ